MSSVLFRAHEWLADRIPWVQYPRQRLIPRQARPPFFKNPMPWYGRALLVLLGILAIGVAIAVLAPMALLAWALFAA